MKHLYEIEIGNGFGAAGGKIEIAANTRSQAAKIARGKGYIVRSINMIG